MFNDIIKMVMILPKRCVMMWAYWLRCGWRLRRGCCEHGYELTGSVNGWEYRDKRVLAGIL
jgi:hypothetical protein